MQTPTILPPLRGGEFVVFSHGGSTHISGWGFSHSGVRRKTLRCFYGDTRYFSYTALREEREATKNDLFYL